MIKKRLIGLVVIAMSLFYGCVKDLHDLGISEATVFQGRVLEESEREPLVNVKVTVTNGTTDYVSTKTNNEGEFELTVNFNKLVGGYYLFLDSGFSGISKKINLKGIGRELYDYGDIFLYNKNDVPASTIPSSPTGVSAEVSGSRIKVSWNSVSNANEYTVYRSDNSSSNYSVIGTTSSSFFYDDDPYENNYYKVKAKNNYGESSYSSYAYCHYSSGGGSAPSAPTGVSAIVSGTRIKVSWNSVSNADEYTVYWSNNGSTYDYVVGTTSDNFIYDGDPYEDNYYKVKATNSYGESPFSPSAYCQYTSGGGGQTYTYTFESGSEDWHQIDADGDGYTWMRWNSTQGNAGHNSEYLITSESYINDVGALYPDNYLYSPMRYSISDGARISFYVCAQDLDWPAEHYGVAISTASGSPSASSFVTIWSETLSAKNKTEGKVRGVREQGTWYLKTIDLSTYAGMTIWIAIRHFDCTDQFRINVDDITIVTGN